MRGRPAIPRLVALLLLATSLAALTGPAQARSTGLLVSRSETGPFADQLPAPLLEGIGRVVPLDRAGDTFYVKNASPRVARTTVAVVNRGAANALTETLTVSVDVAGTVTTGMLPASGSSCELVVTGPDLRPGGVQPVAVSLAVGDLTGQQGVRERFALDVDVTLSHLGGSREVAACGVQAAAGGPPPADCARAAVVTVTGPPRCVPTAIDAGLQQGLAIPREQAAVAGVGVTVLVLGGLGLLAVRRRRQRGPAYVVGA